jgi:general secretion pathway protein A
MYNEYFGFLESPFTATPNSRFFYTNDLYKEALANLRYGIEWKKGLIVMTGEVGTGKTTLLGKIMRDLEATTRPVFVSYDHLTYLELLRIVSRELGLPCAGQDRLAMIERLREYLIVQQNKGHIVALLVDEAQNLSDEMFEDIRFLSNFETEAEKLLQIVLTGQPELEARLDQPNLRHIKQRIVLHCRLAPLKSYEVGRYIDLRLREAGYNGKDLFDRDVVGKIAFYSDGIPRLINIICDNALLLAFAGSKKEVTTEMILEVARDLGLKNRSEFKTETGPPVGKSIAEAEQAQEFLDDEPWSPEVIGTKDPIELQTEPIRREKGQLAWLPIGISLALTVGGAGGVFYSQQIRDFFRKTTQQTTAAEDRHLSVQGPDQVNLAANRAGESQGAVTLIESHAASPTNAGGPNAQRAEPQTSGSKAKQTRLQDHKMEMKEKTAWLGTFRVVGPYSFVRRSPRSDAEIIATLQPRTQVKVVSATGDYFRIQAATEGRTIRGYVHREDAFFGPIDNGKRQKIRNR